uniref:Putative secreted peptide n=1 Tax=Anopheles braziliensis TaxID=58242 RepID=A0A2M3ZR99_9DIPT
MMMLLLLLLLPLATCWPLRNVLKNGPPPFATVTKLTTGRRHKQHNSSTHDHGPRITNSGPMDTAPRE